MTVSHPLSGRLPLLSTRPAVTSPAAEHHHPLAGNKLYCLVTEAHRCEQLAQGCYAALRRAGFEFATYRLQVHRSTHCTTAPSTALLHLNTICITTTTTILWPLYKTTYISRHPQLRTKRILLQQSFTARMPLMTATSAITEKTLEFSSMVLPAPSPYHQIQYILQNINYVTYHE